MQKASELYATAHTNSGSTVNASPVTVDIVTSALFSALCPNPNRLGQLQRPGWSHGYFTLRFLVEEHCWSPRENYLASHSRTKARARLAHCLGVLSSLRPPNKAGHW